MGLPLSQRSLEGAPIVALAIMPLTQGTTLLQSSFASFYFLSPYFF
jgi:hypothetical protein